MKLYNLHAAKYKNEENSEGVSVSETLELVLHRGSSYGRGMKVLLNSDPEACTLRGKLQQISQRPEKRPRHSSPPSRQSTETREPQPGCSTDNVSRFQSKESSRKGYKHCCVIIFVHLSTKYVCVCVCIKSFEVDNSDNVSGRMD